jgi:phage-related protein
MKRRIITFGRYFGEFMEGLTAKEREKVDYGLALLKTQDRLPTKFVKHIKDGLYELRTEYNGNIYRVFFIFDEGNIVVLFNGFQKKTQKTPSSEITKALMIKGRYYEYKRANDSGL